MNEQQHVGQKIRLVREAKQMDIETLANRAQLDVEQIQALENEENPPSLAPLIKIARALGVRLGTFMDDAASMGAAVCRKSERLHSISLTNNSQKTRNHMEYFSLSQAKEDKHMEPFIIDIKPTEAEDFALSSHEGEEFIYVLEGDLEVNYGKETYVLHAGDSIYYDSIVKHHVHGYHNQTAKILAVIYIPV